MLASICILLAAAFFSNKNLRSPRIGLRKFTIHSNRPERKQAGSIRLKSETDPSVKIFRCVGRVSEPI